MCMCVCVRACVRVYVCFFVRKFACAHPSARKRMYRCQATFEFAEAGLILPTQVNAVIRRPCCVRRTRALGDQHRSTP